MGRSCKTQLDGVIHAHKHFLYINSHLNLPSITVVIAVSFYSGFNLNIHASYKCVYFYFELLLSTHMYLPMKK